MFRIIRYHRSDTVFWGRVDTSVTGADFSNFSDISLVWSPVFSIIDTGIITAVVQDSNRLKLKIAGKTFDSKHKYGARILEFLDGPQRGVLRHTMLHRNKGDTIFIFTQDDVWKVAPLPEVGNHIAIYQPGVEALASEFYYDRLCYVRPLFPNTIQPSNTGNPDAFTITDFLTLPEQGGDSIVFLKNFKGGLAVGQKYRIWKLVGPPPWTGSTVLLISEGAGCVAPRSMVSDGQFLYFVGFNNGIPSVFRWDGGELKYNTAGVPTAFQDRGFLSLTTKIDTLMKRVNKAYLHKAAAGLYQNHLLVSLPFAPDTNNSQTIAINLLTGAVAQESFAGALFHSGQAAGDSSQLYFTHDSVGQILLFAGATDNIDTGKTFRSSFQSKWFDFGQPGILKQGLRWWAQYFRADSVADTSRWVVLTDFATTRQDSLVMNGSIGAATAERELNGYMKVGVLGKRLGWRFDGWGNRGNFRLDALRVKLSLRGEGL